MNKIKNPKKWYIRLFTIGKIFNPKKFTDKLKKYSFEFLGFFLVVTFSFYTESKGTDFEMRNNYLDISKSLSDEMSFLLNYTQAYLDQKVWVVKIYQEQYERWEIDNDSVFLAWEPEQEFHFPPMTFYSNRDSFDIPKSTFELFNRGTQDFFMVNQRLSAIIFSLFGGADLKYLISSTSEEEQKFIDGFTNHLATKWIFDLKKMDLDSNEFWIENREYIQNDRLIKYNLFKRIELWLNVEEQIKEYIKTAQKDLNILDEKILEMEAERYFIYWKIPF